MSAEYFYSKIREFDSSRARTSQAIETQTNIMKSMVEIVNDSSIEVEIKHSSLLKNFDHLMKEYEIHEIELGTMEFEASITERITLLNLILTQFAYEIENLVNIVNTALQGVVHSSLLDVKSFLNQLKEIEVQLPIELGIPVELTSSGVLELLRISKVNIVYVKNILNFIIKLPLVNSFNFVLYKSIPLPVNIHNEIFVIIEPMSEYKSRFYIQLNPFQLSQCKTLSNSLICFDDQPVQNAKESCEIMLFRDSKNIPKVCNVKYVQLNYNI